nr:hypothetical protein GCM10020063_019020 [Dactylosporangium thailandense]
MTRHRLARGLACVLASAAVLAAAPAPASADPTPAPSCQVQLIAFPPGFEAVMTVKNTTATPLTGWRLAFRVDPAVTIYSGFGGTITRDGASATVTPAPWFTTLQPGVQANIGFGGSAVPFTPPTAFTLNGVPCTPSGW